MPLIATAKLTGTVQPGPFSPLPVAGEGMGEGPGVRGRVSGPPASSATLTGTVVRSLSFSAPSIAYTVAIKLNGTFIPAVDFVGPFEIDESIDTAAILFSFTLVGRQYSIQSTSTTWTAAPVEVWVTAGPIGALRTWRRAYGIVLTCEQLEGPEPTLRVKCGDPTRLVDRLELCYEFPADAGLTRGDICRQILSDAGFTPDVPSGALYQKPLITDSQRLWSFLSAFGEAEAWSWRLPSESTDLTIQAYTATLRESPEPPDDIWTLRDVLSIESAPPTEVPSQWVLRSTQITETTGGIQITKQRVETFDFYAIKKAVTKQNADGTTQTLPAGGPEAFRRVSLVETEVQTQSGLTIATITREWGWYNPRAAKLHTPFAAGAPPGPVNGYYWAEAFLDEEGSCRTWPQEPWVQIGERRELPTYDDEGTELTRRIETHTWYRRAMGVKNVGSDTYNVLAAAVGDDAQSWYPFQKDLSARLRIEDFGLAQVDTIEHQYGDTGAVTQEIQETFAFYSQRTAIAGVPWFLNANGAGQKDLVANFQRVTRKITTNLLTDDGLLQGKIETESTWHAPKSIAGPNDWGDSSSTLLQEAWGTTHTQTTAYNILDESTYEQLVDQGTGAIATIVMGRPPRPRYRQSTWTQLQQTPFEIILEDPTAAAWWGPSAEVLTLDYAQSPEEALAIATRRRSRRLAHTHTVIRPICATRPGDTILLIDPRSGINHRCLVTRLTETWTFTPRPQILATYTLEQPL